METASQFRSGGRTLVVIRSGLAMLTQAQPLFGLKLRVRTTMPAYRLPRPRDIRIDSSERKVEEVAAHVGLHPNYAMSIFRQTVGPTLVGYITQQIQCGYFREMRLLTTPVPESARVELGMFAQRRASCRTPTLVRGALQKREYPARVCGRRDRFPPQEANAPPVAAVVIAPVAAATRHHQHVKTTPVEYLACVAPRFTIIRHALRPTLR